MKFILSILLALTTATLAQTAARPVQKLVSDNTLTEALSTGAKTLTISATGTLQWTSGATLGGASDFRTAAGLAIGTNVQAWDATLDTVATLTWPANSAGVLENNGSGTMSYRAYSDAPSNGKLAQWGADAVLNAGFFSAWDSMTPTQTGRLYSNGLAWADVADSGFDMTLDIAALTASRTITLPDATGTLITTGNLSAITTTGTITSGTWQGTDIALAYLAQGGATDGQVMVWDNGAGTWEPGTISSGLTIGSTTITSGTSGRILYDNAGVVGELTTTGSGDVVRATSPSFVTSIIVNKSGESESGGIEVADDPANGTVRATFLLPPANGGRIYMGKSGLAPYSLNLSNVTGFEGFPSGLSRVGSFQIILFGGGSISLDPDFGSSGAVNVGSSTTAALFRVNNTFTTGTNHESGVMDWRTTTNTLRIGSDVGSGGGTARDVQLIRGGTVKVTLGANTNTHAQPAKLPSYVVSGLPSAATCGAGSMAWVTDATATTAYSVVAGGGSNQVLVISDGTDWRIH